MGIKGGGGERQSWAELLYIPGEVVQGLSSCELLRESLHQDSHRRAPCVAAVDEPRQWLGWRFSTRVSFVPQRPFVMLLNFLSCTWQPPLLHPPTKKEMIQPRWSTMLRLRNPEQHTKRSKPITAGNRQGWAPRACIRPWILYFSRRHFLLQSPVYAQPPAWVSFLSFPWYWKHIIRQVLDT